MTRRQQHSPARLAAALALLALLLAPQAEAQRPSDQSPLGATHLPISCDTQVQEAFDRAVALLHHMTYPRAQEAFEEITARDPACAMAHWGIAMTLFQPLWPTRPGPEDRERGWGAAQQARALDPPTERERLYVATAEAFFRNPGSDDYWTRIDRWAEAVSDLHHAHPDDREAAALYALARLATAARSGELLANHQDAAEVLLDLYREQPDHPGAIHYTIHANDVAGREGLSLEVVHRYGRIAPRNPHALHMPTHIFVRLGQWDSVIAWNHRAADAALEQPAGDQGQYVWDEYPHAVEYLVYAYLQKGDDSAAAAELDKLVRTTAIQPSFKTAFHLASIPARYALERRAWDEAIALPPRPAVPGLDWDRFPWPEAITWFAEGLGAVHTGDPESADRAVNRLRWLRERATTDGEEYFARQIEILRLQVEAWLVHGQGDASTAIELMNRARHAETTTPKHPVTPAPTLPADELLGDMYMELKQYANARNAYQRVLERAPNRAHSTLGLARAARALGDRAEATRHYRALLELLVATSPRPARREAQQFLSGGR